MDATTAIVQEIDPQEQPPFAPQPEDPPPGGPLWSSSTMTQDYVDRTDDPGELLVDTDVESGASPGRHSGVRHPPTTRPSVHVRQFAAGWGSLPVIVIRPLPRIRLTGQTSSAGIGCWRLPRDLVSHLVFLV